MRRELMLESGARVVLVDSVTELLPEDAGAVAVCGSHGGRSAGAVAERVALRAAVFNDAGVGKGQAGLAALAMLDARGVPAATVSHLSARIGDAEDSWLHGDVSSVNEAAYAAGMRVDQALREAVEHLLGTRPAPPATTRPPAAALPPRAVSVHSRAALAEFLQQDPGLHLYAIGDLDDAFWPATTWYGWDDGSELRAVALIYDSGDLPILLALTGGPLDELRALLQSIRRLLPRRVYAHLTPGLADLFSDRDQRAFHGRYLKMVLRDTLVIGQQETPGTTRLGLADLAEIQAFYAQAAPGHWFDPRTLNSGHSYGLRVDGQLVSVAGIHVYSPRYRVAALGNIATMPTQRGHGYASRVITRLCRELLRTVDHVGLNVRADNAAALAVYTRLGFQPIADYEEWMLP